jgi:hypothetical protein
MKYNNCDIERETMGQLGKPPLIKVVVFCTSISTLKDNRALLFKLPPCLFLRRFDSCSTAAASIARVVRLISLR